jgi:hypothetical protein
MASRTMLVAVPALIFGMAAAAPAANEAVISDVKVIPKINSSSGSHYLSVKFAFTVEEYITSSKSLQINATCKAGERTLHADSFTGISVRRMAKGDSKDGSAVLFMSDRVRDEIEQCKMRFELHTMGRKYSDKPVGTFCWRGGAVSEGDCN